MALIDFELDGKTYRLHDRQAEIIAKIRKSEPTRAENAIRKYAVEVIEGDEIIKSKIEPPSSGQASHGFTSTGEL